MSVVELILITTGFETHKVTVDGQCRIDAFKHSIEETVHIPACDMELTYRDDFMDNEKLVEDYVKSNHGSLLVLNFHTNDADEHQVLQGVPAWENDQELGEIEQEESENSDEYEEIDHLRQFFSDIQNEGQYGFKVINIMKDYLEAFFHAIWTNEYFDSGNFIKRMYQASIERWSYINAVADTLLDENSMIVEVQNYLEHNNPRIHASQTEGISFKVCYNNLKNAREILNELFDENYSVCERSFLANNVLVVCKMRKYIKRLSVVVRRFTEYISKLWDIFDKVHKQWPGEPDFMSYEDVQNVLRKVEIFEDQLTRAFFVFSKTLESIPCFDTISRQTQPEPNLNQEYEESKFRSCSSINNQEQHINQNGDYYWNQNRDQPNFNQEISSAVRSLGQNAQNDFRNSTQMSNFGQALPIINPNTTLAQPRPHIASFYLPNLTTHMYASNISSSLNFQVQNPFAYISGQIHNVQNPPTNIPIRASLNTANTYSASHMHVRDGMHSNNDGTSNYAYIPTQPYNSTVEQCNGHDVVYVDGSDHSMDEDDN